MALVKLILLKMNYGIPFPTCPSPSPITTLVHTKYYIHTKKSIVTGEGGGLWNCCFSSKRRKGVTPKHFVEDCNFSRAGPEASVTEKELFTIHVVSTYLEDAHKFSDVTKTYCLFIQIC